MYFRNLETNALGNTGLNNINPINMKMYFGSFFIHLNKINVISLILSNDCKSQKLVSDTEIIFINIKFTLSP